MLYPSLSFRNPWTPEKISTSLWLDANDSSTIIEIDGKVSEWQDKSGNNRHVSQPNSLQRPAYAVNGINNLPSIDFGVVENSYVLAKSGLINYSPLRYFCVADYDGPNPFNDYRGLIAHNFTSPVDLIITGNQGVNWYLGTNFLNGSSTSSNVALPAILSPFLMKSDAPQNANRADVYIGRDRTFTTRGWLGKIAEVISVDVALSLLDQQKTEGYLAHKWGLTANLPVGHPYKTAPPYK